MREAKLMRQELGLTIEAFADLLGCGKSLYSMVEVRQRLLPAASEQAFLALQNAFAQLQQQKSAPQPDVKAMKKPVQRLWRINRQKLRAIEMKQERLQEQARQLQQCLHVCTHLEQQQSLKDEIAQMRLTIILRKSRQKWNACQAQLLKNTAQLQALEAEKKVLEGSGWVEG